VDFENIVGSQIYNTLLRIDIDHPIENVEMELRQMTPWLQEQEIKQEKLSNSRTAPVD
jgi:ketol-acid reductoisomerase